jgi:hypothetical protein
MFKTNLNLFDDKLKILTMRNQNYVDFGLTKKILNINNDKNYLCLFVTNN